jgi:xanthine dehydrogenase accessory factor
MMESTSAATDPVTAAWPHFGLVDDMRPELSRARSEGNPAVLVTLFAAEGGAPRGIGAQMLVTPRGVVGYLSGGCVEADIALHAATCLEDGLPQRLVYGRGGPADIMLPCGGRIEVLLERLMPDDGAVQRLLDLSQERIPVLWISDGDNRQCFAPGESAGLSSGSGGAARVQRIYQPRPQLVLIGSDPTLLALATLAAPAGFVVAHVRPKGPAVLPYPGARYITSAPEAAIADIRPDRWTAIVVATHDAIDDHDALFAAFGSDAGYIGLLGSRRRLDEKLARLRQTGIGEDQLARLHAPIGIAGLGRGPWDIAVSIQAEIMACLHAGRLTAADFHDRQEAAA